MNDKELEQINTVDVNITAESIDAHVICLRENGYKIFSKSSLITRYLFVFLLGGFIAGSILS
tara:strand:+ start:332 stop:517 length:186 start_codon:yes stop_codon:yes gene_type:complete